MPTPPGCRTRISSPPRAIRRRSGRAIQDRFPRYYRYFAHPVFVYRGSAMRNHNKLLGRVEGVDGIKTGYTPQRLQSRIVGAARRPPHRGGGARRHLGRRRATRACAGSLSRRSRALRHSRTVAKIAESTEVRGRTAEARHQDSPRIAPRARRRDGARRGRRRRQAPRRSRKRSTRHRPSRPRFRLSQSPAPRSRSIPSR